MIAIGRCVKLCRYSPLSEIGSARNGLHPGFGMADDGQQQCGKDGDNRNHHQQLDECECPGSRHNSIIQRFQIN
jgi:hypothetical protein